MRVALWLPMRLDRRRHELVLDLVMMDFSATDDDGGTWASSEHDVSNGELDEGATEVDVEKLKEDLVALEAELAQLRSDLAGADTDVAAVEDGQSR